PDRGPRIRATGCGRSARDRARRGPQAQPHRGAARGPRAGGDLAVLRLGQAADDEQADADTAEPAAVTGLALEEPVEDALVIAVRDADALVFHHDLDPAIGHLGPDADGSSGGRVFESVLEQLPDDDVGGHGVAA